MFQVENEPANVCSLISEHGTIGSAYDDTRGDKHPDPGVVIQVERVTPGCVGG